MGRGNPIGVSLMVLCLVCASLQPTHAAEPVEKFLEGLRNRGYYDLAVDYLDRLAKKESIAPEIRDTILYEQGITLIQSVAKQRDFRAREERLQAAEKKFDEFLQQKGTHALALLARTQQGRVLVERAQIRISRSKSSVLPDKEKTALTNQAVELFEEAAKVFDANRLALQERMGKFPKKIDPDKDRDDFYARKRLRDDYVLVKYQAALLEFEKAGILSKNDPRQKEALESASKRFEEIADKYRRWSFGIEAVFYQGMCKQRLGDLQGALAFYTEFVEDDPTEPGLRRLKTMSLQQAIECWIDKEVGKIDAAIEQGELWRKQQKPSERRLPEWNGFKLMLAKAHAIKAEQTKLPQKTKFQQEARRLINEVAKVPSPYQKEAQSILAGMNSGNSETERPQPKTFVQALEAITNVREKHQVALATVNLVGKRLTQDVDAAERPELEAKVEQAKKESAELREIQIELIQLALSLAGDDIEATQINGLRNQLCYFYFLNENDYEAAVLGEFLGKHFPDSFGSRQSTQIALAALGRIYEARQDAAIGDRILRVAKLIIERWPDSEQADVARNAMVNFSLRKNDFETAEAYLETIPEDSARRGDVELSTGRLLWKRYVDQRKAAIQSDQEESEELKSMKQRALKLMDSGVKRKRSEGISAALLQAVLNLIQNYVEGGAFQEAEKLIDDPEIGPHTLAKRKDDVLERSGMTMRAFTLAIQTYIGSISTGSNAKEAIAKATETLNGLSEYVKQTGAGQQTLIRQYVQLAAELEKQLEQAPKKSRASIASGYTELVRRVAESTQDESLQLWAAQSLVQLGTKLAEDSLQEKEANELLKEGLAIFEKLAKSSNLTEARAKSLEFKIASVHRQVGNFKQSVDALVEMLKRNEMQVHLQIETAKALQSWGDGGNRDAYSKAISGDRLIPAQRRNLVWGWGRLSQLLARNPKHRPLFHEARYNLAICRFRYAMSAPKDKRKKLLTMAKQDVTFTAKMYPQLGGEEQKQRYDELLKQVQRALGEKQVGLQQSNQKKSS